MTTPTPTSPRLLHACAMLGIPARRADRRRPLSLAQTARALHAALPPGGIALLTGPSGAGKTTLLLALARRLRTESRPVSIINPAALPARTPLIDLLPGDINEALAALARAGLADPTLIRRSARTLSTGQRFRLALAVSLYRSPPGVTLLADEFAGVLDRPGALALARAVRRAIRAPCRLVCATPHDDLLEALSPDALLILDEHAPPLLLTRDHAEIPRDHPAPGPMAEARTHPG